MQLVGADGKPVDVPDADVPKAFLEGGMGLPSGSAVPMVAANGQIGHVPAEKAQEAFAAGARVATPEEIHGAEAKKEYDTWGGQIEAGAAGFARGATLGLSDALLPEIVKGAGAGESGAEKVRSALRDLRDVHPITSGVGEGVGMLAPLVGTGGAAAGVEGAEGATALARAAGGGADALRALGAPSRALSAVGDLAEAGARRLVGDAATTLAGRVAQKAVAAGARGAAEGALISGANEIDEASLGDHELAGEKLFAAMGHGALLGAGAGALLSTTGELGRDVLGRAHGKLGEIAETQAWRTISGRKAFQTEAERIPGGATAIGRQLLDDGIVSMGDRVEDIAPKVAGAREEAGAKVGELLDQADAAGIGGVKVANIQRRAVSTLADLRKMANTNAGAIGKAEGVLEDLTNFARESNGVAPDAEASGLAISFRQAQDFRKRLDDLIKWNTNPLAPVNETTVAMKGIRSAIEDEIAEVGDAASKTLGTSWRGAYQDAKLRYRRLLVSDRAATDAVERMQANRAFSATDTAVGAAGMAGGIASHGLIGGLHGIAMGAVHHVIRERGNATAAVILDKLASIGAVQRAAASVDRQIERGVAGVFTPGSRSPVSVRPDPFEAAAKRGEHPYRGHVDAVARAVSQPDAHAEAVARAVSPIAAHAPNVANAFQRAALRGTVALSAAIPAGLAPHRDPLTPQLEKPIVSDAKRAEYDRTRAVVNDPIGAVFGAMAKGTLTREHVDTFKQVAPSLYAQSTDRVRHELAQLKAPIPYAKRTQIATLLGVPVESPEFGAAMQSTHRVQSAPVTPGAAQKAHAMSTPKQREGLADRSRLSGLNSSGGF